MEIFIAKTNKYRSIEEIFGELFVRIQNERIYCDTKTFVDSIAKIDPKEILQIYDREKSFSHFDLKSFVDQYFDLPKRNGKFFVTNRNSSTIDHLNSLWKILYRKCPSNKERIVKNRSTLIELPHDFLVPGGRFEELFYWDSYFTMLGLISSPSGFTLIENLIKNFVYLIDLFGFIPNGNRSYFLSRSQPPVFALMIDLFSEYHCNGKLIRSRYLSSLEKEYFFWMNGKDDFNESEQMFSRHLVRLRTGEILNRYFDWKKSFRPESYPKEEMEREKASKDFGIDGETFYFHNRCSCESGWDFSSRWFADGKSKSSNRCGNLLPIDLNCLIYFLESFLSSIYSEQENDQSQILARKYRQLAQQRKENILKYFWNDQTKFFMDFDPIEHRTTSIFSLAGVFPLFVRIASEEQAFHVYQRLSNEFLQSGGLLTTLHQTGQQWDSPMGWAPLQWISYQSMINYGFYQFANEIRSRWLNTNEQVFQETGKFMEKYNVIDSISDGFGNYPLQDGFGWTNGVYLRLLHG